MNLVFFDTETTGLEAGSRPVDIAAVRVDPAGQVLGAWETLINPGMPMPSDAQVINGITAEQLKGAPSLFDAMHDFLLFCGDAAFGVAHFAPYDVGIITHACQSQGLAVPTLQVIDTCEMAKAIKATPNNKLATLVEHYGIVTPGQAHRAMADTDACRQYYAIAATKTKPAPRPWAADYGFCPDAELPTHLAMLPEMIAAGADFSFEYVDAKGSRTERTILPYGYAKTAKGISFHGMCHDKLERRTFLAERVVVA